MMVIYSDIRFKYIYMLVKQIILWAISWVLITHLVHTKVCSGPKMYGWGQNNEYSCHRINSTWKPFKVGFYLVTCMLFLNTILRIISYKIRPPKLLWMILDEVIQLTIAMELIWLEYHWIWWISFGDLNSIFASNLTGLEFQQPESER